MDALSPRPLPDAGLLRGADHIAPDAAGKNFYVIDRALRDLGVWLYTSEIAGIQKSARE